MFYIKSIQALSFRTDYRQSAIATQSLGRSAAKVASAPAPLPLDVCMARSPLLLLHRLLFDVHAHFHSDCGYEYGGMLSPFLHASVDIITENLSQIRVSIFQQFTGGPDTVA